MSHCPTLSSPREWGLLLTSLAKQWQRGRVQRQQSCEWDQPIAIAFLLIDPVRMVGLMVFRFPEILKLQPQSLSWRKMQGTQTIAIV